MIVSSHGQKKGWRLPKALLKQHSPYLKSWLEISEGEVGEMVLIEFDPQKTCSLQRHATRI